MGWHAKTSTVADSENCNYLRNIALQIRFGGPHEKHSKNCESCPTQVTWKVKFECLFCLSCLSCLSCPWPPCAFWPPWPMTTMDMTTITTTRKLEVERKEVGGCLVSYNLQLAYLRKLEVIWPDRRALSRRLLWMMNGELMNEWMTNVG